MKQNHEVCKKLLKHNFICNKTILKHACGCIFLMNDELADDGLINSLWMNFIDVQ
jgi:hypothetical protein